MKFKRYLATAAILLLSLSIVRAQEQDAGVVSIKTEDGILLVWNDPEIHFTLGIKGKEVRPLEGSEHIFFEVDKIVLQVQIVAIKDFVEDAQKKKPDDKAVLIAHRDWESAFIQSSLLKKDLKIQSTPQKIGAGTDALLWKFEMPAMPDSTAKEQIYLTVVSGGYVVLLNGVVQGDVSDSKVEKFLLDTVATLKTSATPIKLKDVQEAIRKGNQP